MKSLIPLLVIAACATGCIHTEKTVYRNAERLPVSFENDTAARFFYEKLSRTNSNGQRSESTTEVSLPIVFGHKQRTVQGEGSAFNDAVRRCDTNRDSQITEQEARIFAEQSK